MLKHLKKLTSLKGFVIYFVAHAVILVAVVFSAIRIMLPHLKSNLPEIEKLASESFGVDIKVDRMDTAWRGLGPVLRFEGVTMLNAQTQLPLAKIHYFDVELDIFGSIRHWKFMPGSLTLDGISLELLQEPNGNFRLKNHLAMDEAPALDTLATLLSRFQRLKVKNGSLELSMLQGDPVYLHLNYISFSPHGSGYRFETEISGKKIPAHMKVIADIQGELSALENSKIDGYIELDHVAYDARFMPLKFYSIKPQAGNLDLDAWFKWENGRWHELIGEITLNQVMLQNAKHTEVVVPFNFKAKIAWQQLGGDFWRLSGDNIVIQLGEVLSPTAAFLLEGGSFEPWNFKLTTLAISDIIDVLTLSDQIEPATREAMHQLNAQGNIQDIQWIGTPTDEGFKDWHLGMKLHNLNWQAYDKIPAVSNISGEIKLGENQGQMIFDSKEVAIALPSLYEAPLVFSEIQGPLTWTHGDQWVFHSDQLLFETADLEVKSQLTLSIPADLSQTTLDLIATSGEFNQAVAKKYLPTKLLSPGLVQWINQSVETGRVASMRTLVKGPLNRFPYKNGEGDYEMHFSLDEVDLRFHPEWPSLHHLSGELVLDGNGLQANVDSGSLYGSAIMHSTVNLPFAPAPEPLILHMSGSLQGASHDAENFLRESPLWKKIGNIFETVEIRGPLLLEIKSDIPIRGPMDNLKVNGLAALKDGTVNLKKWKLALEDVNGDLQFTQNSVKSTGIRGNFMNKPGVLTANTVTKGSSNEITWNFHSILSKPLIEQFVKSSYWTYFEGSSDYDLSFKSFIPAREEPFSLTLNSNLQGMSLTLPKPLQKTSEQKLPSSVSVTFLSPQLLQAEFHLGEYLGGLMNFNNTKSGYSLVAGQLIAGAEKSNLPMPASGILVTGNTPSLIVQDWTDFFARHNKQFPSLPSQTTPEIRVTDLRAGDLQYKNWHLTKARLDAERTPDAWMLDLNSDQIEGVVRLPHRPELLAYRFDLARCAWPLGPAVSSPTKLIPSDLFMTDFECKQFKYKNNNIGRVVLGIRPNRQTNSVNFEPFLVESSIDKVTAKGEWSLQNGQLATHFKGEVTSENIGASLRGWGLPTDVQDAKGDGKFNLTWPGSPMDISTKGLSGDIEFRMQNGRFTAVNPGFGRMLGLLSFQGLERRLHLDFSDVFKSGFAFNTFKSNIAIKDGYAQTQNSTLKAPAADITLSGRSGLVSHDLDLDMIVQAHVDSTIPAAAVAIANPAAGAAVWIVDKVFNPLGNMTRSRYHITGTWEKPEFTDKTEEYRKELEGPAKVKEAQ